MATPFMTDADFDALDPLMADGWATLGEWTGDLQITIARQNGATNAFDVVSIGLDNREGTTTGTGTPTGTIERSGLLRLWTAAVTTTPVWRGDRFIWNGQACVIVAGPDRKRGGVSEYAFALTGRNA